MLPERVYSDVISLGEASPAGLTSVRFLSCMDSEMSINAELARETFHTNGAEKLLPTVRGLGERVAVCQMSDKCIFIRG